MWEDALTMMMHAGKAFLPHIHRAMRAMHLPEVRILFENYQIYRSQTILFGALYRISKKKRRKTKANIFITVAPSITFTGLYSGRGCPRFDPHAAGGPRDRLSAAARRVAVFVFFPV